MQQINTFAALIDVRDRWSFVNHGQGSTDDEYRALWAEMIRAGYDPLTFGPFYITDPAEREHYIVLWDTDDHNLDGSCQYCGA